MLVDVILDRKCGGIIYSASAMYNYCMGYDNKYYQSVSRALDSGEEIDVKKALCSYIVENNYNLEILTYILSVNWLEGC